MLDAGPLIDLFCQKPQAARAQQVLEKYEKDHIPVLYNLLIVAEVHRRILFDKHRQAALEFAQAFVLRGYRVVEILSGDVDNALDILQRYSDQDISYTDAVIMAQMKRLEIHNVFSYDYHFDIVGFNRVS